MHRVSAYQELNVAGTSVLPLRVFHGKEPILGFRIGKFAYLTDCSRIPDETYPHLQGLDLLILDGLRERPHKTHYTQEQAAREAEKIGARMTYLTHIAHEVDHVLGNENLRNLAKIPLELSYDGLVVEVED
jgi:phosphoribosyl 1,2-cyclic phosphate phosphodiesterase